MKTLSVNSNNDIFIGSGVLSLSTDLQAVLLVCEQVAKAQLGEMIYAQDRGIPNFQTIWTSSANIAQFEAYLRRNIRNVEGVTGIKSLTTDVQNNILSYSIEIETIYGNGTINGV